MENKSKMSDTGTTDKDVIEGSTTSSEVNDIPSVPDIQDSKSTSEQEQPAAESENRDVCDVQSTTSSMPDEMSDGEKSLRSRRSSTSTPTKISPTPSGSKSGRLSGSASSSRTTTPPIDKIGKFPARLGITWAVGTKVEAKDFLDKWYPARIVEIDDDDLTALVHFEGWNSRYDEWMDMNTERLRPMTRHSERKEKPRTAPRGEHRIGECVFAKWTDCRMYAARVININSSGAYEVLFYDGVKKTVQPINIKTMPPDVQTEYASAGLLPPAPKRVREIERQRMKREREREQKRKERENREREREKNKAAPAEKGKSRESSTEKSKGKESETTKRKSSCSKKEEGQKRPQRRESRGRLIRFRGFGRLRPNRRKESSEDSKASTGATNEGPKKRKLVIGGIFQAKRATGGPPDEKPEKDKRDTKPAVSPTVSKPEKPPVTTAPESFLMQILKCTQGPISCTSPALYSFATTSSTSTLPAKASKKRHPSAGSVDSRSESLDSPGTPLVEKKAPKEFKIEEDHNPYKCSIENCNKGFRKQSLLDYHIKYYHTDDGKTVAPPPRKRKKTTSICSTDSDISVGGRSSSSKSGKKKRDSIASTSSVPETPADVPPAVENIADDESTVDYNTEVQTLGAEDLEIPEATVEEDVESELERSGGNKDEVVNCICQLNDENGLMIQCDVCLCWQHAVCMEFTELTVPKRYVCYICANPPGVRENARFIYSQEWFKEGNLARFNFLPVDENKYPDTTSILATHNLTAAMHNIQQVLGALNQQLHILQEKDHNHPEFQLWTRNWDREMERQKLEIQESMDVDGEHTMDTSISESSSAVDSIIAKVETVTSAPENSVPPSTPETAKLETVKEESVEEVQVKSEKDQMKPVEETLDSKAEIKIKSEEVKKESLDLKFIDENIKEKCLEDNSETDTASQLSENEDMGKISENDEGIKAVPHGQEMNGNKGDSIIKDESLNSSEAKKPNDAASSSAGLSDGATPSRSETPNSHVSSANLHDYSLGPIPSGVKLTGTRMWPTVKNKANNSVDQDGDDLESDVSVVTLEEDPFVNCEKNLLEHIMNVQDKLESRFDAIEEQITALEEADQAMMAAGPAVMVGRIGVRPRPNSSDILSDLPHLRKQVHQLIIDLSKVKRMARYH